MWVVFLTISEVSDILLRLFTYSEEKMDSIPFAMPQDFTLSLARAHLNQGQWFIFSKQLMLVSEEGKRIPKTANLPSLREVYVGYFKGESCFAAEIAEDVQAPSGWMWSCFRSLHGVLPKEEYALAGRALQLLEWDRTHTYCGTCGQKTFPRKEERCRECSSCGQLAYPKLAPAIMALVQREEKILLARGSHFPQNMYSVLAGYLDVGETLEQCVVREVQEEVGLKVGNVRYMGSQPWPFTGSLMVGFACDWLEGDIIKDPLEIEEAGWFARDELPIIPTEVSLAYWLIDSWKRGRLPS